MGVARRERRRADPVLELRAHGAARCQRRDQPGGARGSGGAEVDPVDLALPILLNELAASSTPHVLVLDDFHVLRDPRIHEGVEFLVAYLPASLRLVHGRPADPPLPIARLRARGELTELRAADLRLSRAESAALVSTVSGTELDAGRPRRCGNGRRAGRPVCSSPAWPAGQPRDTDGGPVRGDDRHLLDYFTAEVLPAVTPEQRDLLVRAAPLERCRVRCATRRCRSPVPPRCWPRWTGPISSWSHSTTSTSGTGAIACCATCCCANPRPGAPTIREVLRRAAAWFERARPDRRRGAPPPSGR